MKLSVEFPAISFREGPEAIARLAKAIEEIGYDHIDIFDHVVMGYPTETRAAPHYPSRMPILEALTTLSFIAANTKSIGIGTEVLVLPQRQPVLVAKQVATLDILSAGRMRLGVGVGWQESEFEMLQESFRNRGKRTDEAIQVLRACWGQDPISYRFKHYFADSMAFEPKPPQGDKIPIWIGGMRKRALRRVGEFGDGWLAMPLTDLDWAKSAVESIKEHAVRSGRDPDALGFQMMLDSPPQDEEGKTFYKDMDKIKSRIEIVEKLGFGWGSINATAIFQAGYRTVDAMIDKLSEICSAIR
ncbi:MAG: LLM class F420-dependent oxidoreductase [Gammaproteobacteria bacterium]|nr:LLM class F420-dependent oxidoreductase [Gammaproteobacteria bacterium]